MWVSKSLFKIYELRYTRSIWELKTENLVTTSNKLLRHKKHRQKTFDVFTVVTHTWPQIKTLKETSIIQGILKEMKKVYYIFLSLFKLIWLLLNSITIIFLVDLAKYLSMVPIRDNITAWTVNSGHLLLKMTIVDIIIIHLYVNLTPPTI